MVLNIRGHSSVTPPPVTQWRVGVSAFPEKKAFNVISVTRGCIMLCLLVLLLSLCHTLLNIKASLYRIWCGVNRLGDSGLHSI